jgi:Rieske Fe-S protein
MGSSRREFIRRMAAASILLVTGAVAVWELAELGSGEQPAETNLLQTATTRVSATSGQGTSQSATQTAPQGYIRVASMSALGGKSSAYFNHPTHGLALLLSLGGQWKAFDATCTHAPCTVEFTSSQIYCPCHGGIFDPSNGAVTSGPPPTRLPEYGVLIRNNDLYVSDGIVN